LGLNEGRYYDSLLDFYRIDLAAAFFAPSVSFLEAAVQGSLHTATAIP
jgi:putative iron-dependent peroxidase